MGREVNAMLITEKELEHRITETFPKLAKKHHISDEVTEALIQELSSALKTPSQQSYEEALFYVKQAWGELKKCLSSPMYSIYFDTFAHAEILDNCTDALTQAGLDPVLSLGKRTEEFLVL